LGQPMSVAKPTSHGSIHIHTSDSHKRAHLTKRTKFIRGLSRRMPPRSPLTPHYAAAVALCCSPLTIPPLLDPVYRWRFPLPGDRGDARANGSEPAGRRPLEPVLLVAAVSEDGESTVKLGGGRGRRDGCRPAEARGGACLAAGRQLWSTSRWSPPRASAVGIHLPERLLPVTTSTTWCLGLLLFTASNTRRLFL
jgi:hypothetical protein